MTVPKQSNPILSATGVSKAYGPVSGQLWAVHDVSLSLDRGECLAIVGESGSGKSTLAKLILGLIEPTAGRITFEGADLSEYVTNQRGRRRLSQQLQMVFQDPHSSLNPAMSVAEIVAEPLQVFGWVRRDIQERVSEVLSLVGLSAGQASRRPRELSGGQRQRVGIARALAPRPKVLLLDEPVASLDVSIQGQILQLLKDIQAATDISIVMIAHDLGVVRAIADRTLVMYLGRVVEAGSTDDVFVRTLHPYSGALLSSASADGRNAMADEVRDALANEALSLSARSRGCVFRSRCWRAISRCEKATDTVRQNGSHVAFCNVPLENGLLEARL